ncbi:hypothetical protein GCM10010841_26530 [Deinococcus aerophilus]|uniref:Prepilin-type cleavage/methylation domain-containing protein n=1 Tax=Deinococcus aerophilus TaxID=522488 RepID=A0ABQ2GXQ8_9DEIO|nr:hypothetical protein GCM10010841_26530 [Deinococcus aerophilus]
MKTTAQAFTLIELLVTMALGLIVLTIVFNLFASSTTLVETDTGRVMASQNAQTALDILAGDVRQAGENLELAQPRLGVSGVEFGPGGSGTPAFVTVRRNIPPHPTTRVQLQRLPLCAKSGANLQVAGPPPSSVIATGPCASSDVNVGPWRDHFAAQSGRAQAALLYCDTCGTGGTRKITRVAVLKVGNTVTTLEAGTTVNRISVTLRDTVPSDYRDNNNSMLMLIDERRYFLAPDNTLRLALAGQTDSEAEPVAFDVAALKVTADLIAEGTTPAQNGVTSMGLEGPWSRLKQVNLTLTGGNAGQGRARTRTFEARVFPRNVESSR